MSVLVMWAMYPEAWTPPAQHHPGHVPSRTAPPLQVERGRGTIVGEAYLRGRGHKVVPSEADYLAAGMHGRALAMRVERQHAEDELLLLGLL